MNCNDVRPLLAAYLDDEVTTAERDALQDHISGCETCQQAMSALWKTQSRLRGKLKAQANAIEAPADAWGRLQVRLASEPPAPRAHQKAPTNSKKRLQASEQHQHGETDAMNKQPSFIRTFSIAAVAVAALAFVGIVIVKPLVAPDSNPAQLGTPSPFDESTTPAIGTETMELTPTYTLPDDTKMLEPTRLPDGMYYMTNIDLSGLPGKAIVFYNVNNDDFMIVRQITADAAGPLPEGEEAQIGPLTGVVLAGQTGTTSIPSDGDAVLWREVNYSNATTLSWDTMFYTRVDITTTLDKDKTIAYANSLALQFDPFSPGDYTPIEGGLTSVQVAINAGILIQEDHYMGNNGFISLNQSPNAIGEALGGEMATLEDGTEAILYRDESGTFLTAQYFGGMEVNLIGGGGGGGGGGPEYVPYEPPTEIPYTGGARLVWVKNGVRLSALTNLPAEELIRFASGLRQGTPHSGPLVTGAIIDMTVLPAGGALAGYEFSRPDVLQELFYGQVELTVTEGDGLIIEKRYFNNDQFVILTSQKDDGVALQGVPTQINGGDGVFTPQVGGTALLNALWNESAVLQDRIPRYLVGMSSGSSGVQEGGVQPTWPAELDFQDGTRVEWKLDGAKITLLTNLPQDQALEIAGQVTMLGKIGMILNPNEPNSIGQLFVSGFDLYGPTYIPAALDTITPASDIEGTPAALFAAMSGNDFVRIEMTNASEGPALPTIVTDGEGIEINGQGGTLQLVSGSFESRYYGPDLRTFTYTDAVQITWKVGNTLIRVLTNLSWEEAIRIAEGMQIAK